MYLGRKKKRLLTGVGLSLLILIFSGTFAWVASNQGAFNPAWDHANHGGRIHDHYDGYGSGEHNKDVFAENFGGQDLFTRIRLREFLAVDGESVIDGMLIDDISTWAIYLSEPNDVHAPRIGSDIEILHGDYEIEWALGQGNRDSAEKWFMPTHNQATHLATLVNPSVPPLFATERAFRMSESAGRAVDQIASLTTTAFDPTTPNEAQDFFELGQQTDAGNSDGTHDFWESESDPLTATLIYTVVDEVAGTAELRSRENVTHHVQQTLLVSVEIPEIVTPTQFEMVTGQSLEDFYGVMTIANWNDLNRPRGNFWIHDADGWFYWNGWLPAGEATSLLLDGIYLPNRRTPWGHVIYVEGDFFTPETIEYLNLQSPISSEARAIFSDLSDSDSGDDQRAECEECVYYSDFGAVGDGITNDFPAIVAAHAYANLHGLPVRADAGATYYIGGDNITAIIQTNTDWGDAHFIIDDRNVVNRFYWIFSVQSTYEHEPLGLDYLPQGHFFIGRTFNQRSLVIVEDSTTPRHFRRGPNADAGSPQQEVFIVDVNGVVCPTTPIIWDYNQITFGQVRPIPDEQLTITGGTFTVIANESQALGHYYSRGIWVERSNVSIDGLTHLVENDGNAAPYWGFIHVQNAAYVSISNTILTSYQNTVHGTYGLLAGRVANLHLSNVHQSNDITDPNYWGIFSSNFTRNITWDNVSLSRFGAHRGLHNATIRNSNIGRFGISVTGSGELLVENSEVTGAGSFIFFREDFGSHWDGDVIIRDSRFVPPVHGWAVFINGFNDGLHNFGHDTTLPHSITVENLHVYDYNIPWQWWGLTFLTNFDTAENAPFPHGAPGPITIRNLTRSGGQHFNPTHNEEHLHLFDIQ